MMEHLSSFLIALGMVMFLLGILLIFGFILCLIMTSYPDEDVSSRESTYIVTDGCMWERNKQDNTKFPHSIEVCDAETGQMRYIKGGSKIKFVEGDITETRNQEIYNSRS